MLIWANFDIVGVNQFNFSYLFRYFWTYFSGSLQLSSWNILVLITGILISIQFILTPNLSLSCA